DIDQKCQVWSEVFGLPKPEPITTATADLTHIQYKGRTTEARARLAFFEMENVTIELIEPIGGPSTWKAFLDRHGEGVHHIAFKIKGTDQVVAFLEGKHCKLEQSGDFVGGKYAYVDATKPLGVILELLEIDEKPKKDKPGKSNSANKAVTVDE
ncbi:MAG TPA: VOC family protein, partial [Planctomycetota bacterium]|nr:VOC family protein [Planctomycetota bacterium]